MSWEQGYFKRYKERFEAMSPYIEKHNKIADLGIGAGGYYFGLDTAEIVGVDTNGVVLKRAKDFNSKIETIKKDILESGLPDKEYSLVVLSQIIEHFADYHPLIKEAKRICKDDGYFLITLPINYEDPLHYFPQWSEEKVKELAKEFGELIDLIKLSDSWVAYVKRT